jgi:hypothetical protein
VDSAVFDEGNLVSHAGLVPVLELAERAGLSQLLDEHVRFVDERVKSGVANPTPKLTSIIAEYSRTASSPRASTSAMTRLTTSATWGPRPGEGSRRAP